MQEQDSERLAAMRAAILQENANTDTARGKGSKDAIVREVIGRGDASVSVEATPTEGEVD